MKKWFCVCLGVAMSSVFVFPTFCRNQNLVGVGDRGKKALEKIVNECEWLEEQLKALAGEGEEFQDERRRLRLVQKNLREILPGKMDGDEEEVWEQAHYLLNSLEEVEQEKKFLQNNCFKIKKAPGKGILIFGLCAAFVIGIFLGIGIKAFVDLRRERDEDKKLLDL